MDKNHDLTVNVTPTTGYAGNSIEYDIMVGLVGSGHPDEDGLTVELRNETGALVTGDDALDY